MDFLAKLMELFENIFKVTFDFDVSAIFAKIKEFFNGLSKPAE